MSVRQKITLERSSPRIRFGWIILNHYGSPWNDTLYAYPEDAWSDLRAFWGGRDDLGSYRVVEGKQSLEVLNFAEGVVAFSAPAPKEPRP